jgi:hypothetical protein
VSPRLGNKSEKIGERARLAEQATLAGMLDEYADEQARASCYIAEVWWAKRSAPAAGQTRGTARGSSGRKKHFTVD